MGKETVSWDGDKKVLRGKIQGNNIILSMLCWMTLLYSLTKLALFQFSFLSDLNLAPSHPYLAWNYHPLYSTLVDAANRCVHDLFLTNNKLNWVNFPTLEKKKKKKIICMEAKIIETVTKTSTLKYRSRLILKTILHEHWTIRPELNISPKYFNTRDGWLNFNYKQYPLDLMFPIVACQIWFYFFSFNYLWLN